MWDFRTSSPDRYHTLKAFARENRRHPTEAEGVLWGYIRHSIPQTKVLRQHIIGDYIVDFLLPFYRLVIEVDGGYHAERTQQEDDALRAQWLNAHGFYVLRFSNKMVLSDFDYVIERITQHIDSYNK